jgi:hypothetical protein
MDISRSTGSIGSIGHFPLAISMAYYLHDVRHMLVITSFKDVLIDQLKMQMSDGNLTCSLDPMDKQNTNGHFQVHWIHWIHCTLSFRYLNGLVSTRCPYACHYVIQIHINWPTEKANVRWKFLLDIGSNGQTKFQWTFQVHWIHWIHLTLSSCYLNGLVCTWCPYACHNVIQRHGNWLNGKANIRWKFHVSIGSNGQN